MKILIVGGEAENTALVEALRPHERAHTLLLWPPGRPHEGVRSFNLSAYAPVSDVAREAVRQKVSLVILNSEDAARSGLANVLDTLRVPCLGPSTVSAHFLWDRTYLHELMRDCGVASLARSAHLDKADAYEAALRQLSRDGQATVGGRRDDGKRLWIECMTRSQVDQVFADGGRFSGLGGISCVEISRKVAGTNIKSLFLVNGRHLEALGCVQVRPGGTYGPLAPKDLALATNLAGAIAQALADRLEGDGAPYTGFLALDLVTAVSAVHVADVTCAVTSPLVAALRRVAAGDWLPRILDTLGLGPSLEPVPLTRGSPAAFSE